jgi:D-alanyl-D-alanine carboxypeptidase
MSNCVQIHKPLRDMVLAVAVAGALLSGGIPAGASDEREEDVARLVQEIDCIMREQVADNQPGMAVIAERAGRQILRRGYGMADLELGVPVEPGMVFRIGSVTKQITALAIMKLAEEGRLSLEDPVMRHIPDLPDRFGNIRIKHLLSNTSGIADYMHAASFDTLIQEEYHAIVNEDLDLDRIFRIIAAADIAFEPGERYAYSNSNYFLLGMIIEKVSGEPFFDFIKREICERAGMSNTYYMANAMLVPGRVPVHVEYEGRFIKSPHRCMGSTLGFGCGGLWSTVDDLASYNRALESGQLVSAEAVVTMSTPYVLNDGRPSRYGLGWQTARLKGRDMVFHGGDYTGYSALIVRIPSERIFIAMLSCDGTTPAMYLEHPAKRIAALLFNDPFPDWKAIEMAPEVIEKYVGTYRMAEDNVREFMVEDGQAYTRRNHGGRLEVYPASDTIFFYTVTTHYIEFELDEDGIPVRMIMHRDSGEDEIAEKIR